MILEAALAIAAISTTISKSSAFRFLQQYKLFRCPYCLNHWLALGYMLFDYPKSGTPLDFIINCFVIVTLASGCGYVLALYLKEIDRA
jgi:hypothetical protein